MTVSVHAASVDDRRQSARSTPAAGVSGHQAPADQVSMQPTVLGADGVYASVCPLDCPDTCAVRITIKDKQVVQLSGDADHPMTQGFACVKTYRYPERQEAGDRLLHPLVRVAGKDVTGPEAFREASWEEALQRIVSKLASVVRARGPRAILPFSYAGTMGLVERDHPLAFFRALGACELDWTICAATGGAGWEANYGPLKVSVAPEQVADSKLVLLWGINALRSHSHLAPWIKRARQSGARVLHIDPYRNETSRLSDEHWQIRVGTDTALALAIANYLFEHRLQDSQYLSDHASGLDAFREAASAWTVQRAADYCGLDPARIAAIAHQYGTLHPTYLKVGYGLTRNEGGGNAIRAITLLPAITGAWRRGGGASLSTSGAFPLNRTHANGLHLLQPNVRHVNQNHLASTLLDQVDPIDCLIVFNSNPAAVAPDSSRVRAGLRRDDLFTVVIDHFMTDTADHADVVLPATTFLEHEDIYTSYGHYYLQYASPVVPPRGEARPNSWIFRELAKRMGLTDPTLQWSTEETIRSLLDCNHPWLDGITLERLQCERSVRLNIPKDWMPYAEGSHFEDRKIRFSPPPTQLTFQEQPCHDYPLRLISPPGSHLVNTSMGNVPSIRKLAGGEPTMLLHPADAQRYTITDGHRATITSRYGSIKRRIRVSEDAREGVLVALGQWWPKHAPDGKSLNDLTSERLTDLGGGSTFGNVTVRVTP
jgi:anaerobic selenocysteine-containing dehydrogenase